jgi:hypothetical protein
MKFYFRAGRGKPRVIGVALPNTLIVGKATCDRKVAGPFLMLDRLSNYFGRLSQW